MDDRLGAVREEVESGSVSPQSLVLLFNVASDAEHAGDVATLERTLDLARAIAAMAGENLRAEAERLAGICEQSLASVRERLESSGASEPRAGSRSVPSAATRFPQKRFAVAAAATGSSSQQRWLRFPGERETLCVRPEASLALDDESERGSHRPTAALRRWERTDTTRMARNDSTGTRSYWLCPRGTSEEPLPEDWFEQAGWRRENTHGTAPAGGAHRSSCLAIRSSGTRSATG